MKFALIKTRCMAVGWVLSLLLVHSWQAHAVLFDWDTVTWTPGSLSNSYEIDSSNPGNDITITITGNTTRFISNYPRITQDFEGGLSPTEDILDVFVNFGNRNQTVTITVTFNYALGVEDVGFTLFDIDRNGSQFIDQIRTIKANYNGGSDIAATSVTGSADNTVSGSGLGVKVTGTALTPDVGGGSGDANATISFGGNAITEFSFVYGDDPGVQSNPAQQGIGFHDISFKKKGIPEYHPALAASLMCGMLGAWRSVRRRLAGS